MRRKQAFRIAMDREKLKKKEKADLPIKKESQDHIAYAIDNIAVLNKFKRQVERLCKTNDVQAFIQDLAPQMAIEVVTMISDPDLPAKVKADLLKDFMDRAGYGKVTKHAVARFNASDSKDAIISSILGAKKDLGKMGIEIVDETDEETTGEPSEG